MRLLGGGIASQSIVQLLSLLVAGLQAERRRDRVARFWELSRHQPIRRRD